MVDLIIYSPDTCALVLEKLHLLLSKTYFHANFEALRKIEQAECTTRMRILLWPFCIRTTFLTTFLVPLKCVPFVAQIAL